MEVEYKKIANQLVLMHTIHGRIRDLPEVFDKLREKAGDAANGNPVVVQHWPLTDEQGRTMDICIPLSKEIDGGEFKVTTLEGGLAATAIHRGPYENIMEVYQKLIPAVYKHGHPIQENGREVFPNLDLESPENTVVEIQGLTVGWEGKFDKNLERVLGEKKKEQILEGFKKIRVDTPQEERSGIIADALRKLDDVATEDEKYEVLSRCGHQFPAELIEDMRNLYRETKSIDAVIQAMMDGHAFYPKLRREGNIIYDRKGAARAKALEKAETKQDKMRAICFCPLLKDVWDDMPGTFCYCAAGWPRRLIEGIIEQPVKVEVVSSLTKGDEYCEFAIHLPEGVT